MSTDIRWKQRFDNYSKVFLELQEAVDLARTRPLSKLEKQGTIQGFEYTHELAWNVLKDYLEYQGIVGLIGSRNTTRAAFQHRLDAAGFDEISTEVAPAPTFFYAEDYHQQYLHKVPNGYCGLGGTGVSSCNP